MGKVWSFKEIVTRRLWTKESKEQCRAQIKKILTFLMAVHTPMGLADSLTLTSQCPWEADPKIPAWYNSVILPLNGEMK